MARNTIHSPETPRLHWIKERPTVSYLETEFACISYNGQVMFEVGAVLKKALEVSGDLAGMTVQTDVLYRNAQFGTLRDLQSVLKKLAQDQKIPADRALTHDGTLYASMAQLREVTKTYLATLMSPSRRGVQLEGIFALDSLTGSIPERDKVREQLLDKFSVVMSQIIDELNASLQEQRNQSSAGKREGYVSKDVTTSGLR